ncbi:hypothetical protein N0V87_000286 [Didymella glomerata]|uniref:Uncharacterized protein n=1 Tax=Didymella glomerata TaxID=749621 RepID=A0A9W8X7X1_9PLEO|nr:hypothetical protein N0V87_000286 [Didymella glomerata]
MPKPDKPTSVEKAEHRSGYGDMHAHREAEGMKEHVARLRADGQIDEKMATELLKPLDKKREYTADYLATLPTYTDQQPDVVSFETAEKHRRKRDKEQLKWIEDYEAGRIDENGNRLVPDNEDGGSEHGSVVSQMSDVSVEERVDVHLATRGKILPLRPRNFLLTVMLGPSSSPEPVSPPSHKLTLSSAQPSPAQQPRPRRSKPTKVVVPDPLPNGETYEAYSYVQLVAAGRYRQIYTPGSKDGVRKALIEDGFNIDKGLQRNFAPWKKDVNKYKTFKTKVPEELKNPATKEPVEEDEDEEEE